MANTEPLPAQNNQPLHKLDFRSQEGSVFKYQLYSFWDQNKNANHSEQSLTEALLQFLENREFCTILREQQCRNGACITLETL